MFSLLQLTGEWARGIAPRAPPRTVRERLRSYGSHNRTALHHLPVSEQRRSTPGQPGDPLMCTSLTTAKPLEFLGRPTRQRVVHLE